MALSSNGSSCPRRVLFLTCHLPWPPLSGGRRRELELLRRLSKWFEIHLVVVSKTPRQDRANASAHAQFCVAIEVFAADEADDPAAPLQVRRHHCPQANRRIREILDSGQIDLVHAEGFYLMQHLPQAARQPVLLVEQNVEYELARQRASVDGPVTRLERFSDWARTQLAERECWRRANSLGAVTDEDRDLIAAACPGKRIHLIPDGADHIARAQDRASPWHRAKPLVVYVANFGYGPNVDGALHLCRTILPIVRRRVPDLELWLVGNAPPDEVQALDRQHVRVTGRVADVLPYLDAADVIVCPLRVGGGIKVKTIEALRRGKAIVTTSIGAQGLPAPASDALVVVDEAAPFADAVCSLLLDRHSLRALESRARRAAAALPSWDDAAAALADAYHELVDRSVPQQVLATAGGSI